MMHPERNVEQTMEMLNCGANWIRQCVEESMNQQRTMLEASVTTARRTADNFDQQSAAVIEASISLVRETLNFVQQAMHVREPHNLLQLQGAFMCKQAELLAEQSKHVAESFAREANEVGRMTSQGVAEASRKSSKAA
jgi:hypothetical protein